MSLFLDIVLALIITCLAGQFVQISRAHFWKFWNFEISRVIYSKNHSNQTCGYWLITRNQQNFVLKLILLIAGNYKSTRRQLQYNSVNGAMLITIDRVIKQQFILPVWEFVAKKVVFWKIETHVYLEKFKLLGLRDYWSNQNFANHAYKFGNVKFKEIWRILICTWSKKSIWRLRTLHDTKSELYYHIMYEFQSESTLQ